MDKFNYKVFKKENKEYLGEAVMMDSLRGTVEALESGKVTEYNREDVELSRYVGLLDVSGKPLYDGDKVSFNPLYEREGTIVDSVYKIEIFDGEEHWRVNEKEDITLLGDYSSN